MPTYTGIGSRETPDDKLELIRTIAKILAKKGYTLRSGGADGADTAFEQGCDAGNGKKEIYLPWQGFNKNKSTLWNIPPKAFVLASEHHPRWKLLRRPVQQLMARNTLQILGVTVDAPTDFVICWTPDGCSNADSRTRETGGTGQAIAIAASLFIPVYNLQNHLDYDTVIGMINETL